MNSKILQSALALLVVAAFMPALPAQVGRISGVVMDEEGNPLKDVIIRIEGMDIRRNYKLKSGKDGKFIHAGVVVQGRYRVIAEKEGYQSDYFENVKPSFADDSGIVEFILKKGSAGVLGFELTDEERAEIEKRNRDAQKQRELFQEVKVAFDQGLEAYNAEDYELALGRFQEAADKDPSQKAVWANLANTQSRLGRNDEAIASYQKALAIDSQDASLYQNLGNVYATKGEIDKAQEYYAKAAEIGATQDPKTAAITYYNMGVTYINEGNNEGAAEALLKCLQFDETYSEAHYQLGLTFLNLNRMEEAVKHLKRYLELDPSGENAETAKALVEALGG